MSRILLLLCFLGLTACTINPPDATAILENKSICCRSYSDMQFVAMEEGSEQTFKLIDQEVYNFGNSSSFFIPLAFALTGEAKTIEIETLLVGNWIPNSYVFWPSFITLDREFNQVRHVVNLKLKKEYKDSYVSADGTDWGNEILLYDNEKYIIFYSDQSAIGKEMEVSCAGNGYAYSTGNGTVYVPSTGTTCSNTTISYGGKLRVKY